MTRMGMGAYDTPKAYLDAQLTYEHPAERDALSRAQGAQERLFRISLLRRRRALR